MRLRERERRVALGGAHTEPRELSAIALALLVDLPTQRALTVTSVARSLLGRLQLELGGHEHLDARVLAGDRQLESLLRELALALEVERALVQRVQICLTKLEPRLRELTKLVDLGASREEAADPTLEEGTLDGVLLTLALDLRRLALGGSAQRRELVRMIAAQRIERARRLGELLGAWRRRYGGTRRLGAERGDAALERRPLELGESELLRDLVTTEDRRRASRLGIDRATLRGAHEALESFPFLGARGRGCHGGAARIGLLTRRRIAAGIGERLDDVTHEQRATLELDAELTVLTTTLSQRLFERFEFFLIRRVLARGLQLDAGIGDRLLARGAHGVLGAAGAGCDLGREPLDVGARAIETMTVPGHVLLRLLEPLLGVLETRTKRVALAADRLHLDRDDRRRDVVGRELLARHLDDDVGLEGRLTRAADREEAERLLRLAAQHRVIERDVDATARTREVDDGEAREVGLSEHPDRREVLGQALVERLVLDAARLDGEERDAACIESFGDLAEAPRLGEERARIGHEDQIEDLGSGRHAAHCELRATRRARLHARGHDLDLSSGRRQARGRRTVGITDEQHTLPRSERLDVRSEREVGGGGGHGGLFFDASKAGRHGGARLYPGFRRGDPSGDARLDSTLPADRLASTCGHHAGTASSTRAVVDQRPSMASPASEIDLHGYVTALRRRARRVFGWSVVLRLGAAATTAIAIAALVLGADATPTRIGAAWTAVLATIVFLAWRAWRARPIVAGARVAELVAPIGASLAQRLRSAIELEAGDTGASASLVAAHRHAIALALAPYEPREVVPWARAWGRFEKGSVVALLASALILFAHGRAAAGLFALTHESAWTTTRPEGLLVASLTASVRMPQYLGQADETLTDPATIACPEGATVRLEVTTRTDVSGLSLARGADDILHFESRGPRTFVVQFLATLPSDLRIEGVADGVERHDAVVRRLEIIRDVVPAIAWITPTEDRRVGVDDAVELTASVVDDHGISRVEAIFAFSDGREERRTMVAIAPFPFAALTDTPADTLGGAYSFTTSLGELGAIEGDVVVVTIEATDAAPIEGDRHGRSAPRTLSTRTVADRRNELVDTARALRDAAVDALAVWLEGDALAEPTSTDAPGPKDDLETRRAPTDGLIERLRRATSSNSAEEGRTMRRTDRRRLEQLTRSVAQALERLTALHVPIVRAMEDRQQSEGALEVELERTTLELADLVSRVEVEDAAAITRELEAIRRELASLVSELQRTGDPEVRRRVMSAIARAEARIASLRRRMSEMATRLPAEFANEGTQDLEASEQALRGLREAMEGGDLDEATRAVTRLEQEIDSLARALGRSEDEALGESFSARDRALAEAIDRMMGLEAEQRAIADTTSRTRGDVARRALEAEGASPAARHAMAERARAMRETLDAFGRELRGDDREAYERAHDRLRDIEDALEAGDLGEAERMSAEAVEATEGLARELELEALMFGSGDHALDLGAMFDRPRERGRGSSSQETRRSSAESAGRVAREMDELRTGVERLVPDLDRHVTSDERRLLGETTTRQRRARDAAQELAEQLGGEVGGSPLTPEIGERLGGVAGQMGHAADALERRDLADASRAESDAAHELAELRRSLEQAAERERNGSSGGGDGSGGGDEMERRPVDIPRADAFHTPMERRRRVLDAMNDGTPRGYEDSARRYYEGLLR